MQCCAILIVYACSSDASDHVGKFIRLIWIVRSSARLNRPPGMKHCFPGTSSALVDSSQVIGSLTSARIDKGQDRLQVSGLSRVFKCPHIFDAQQVSLQS
jgi:hypothetical protein